MNLESLANELLLDLFEYLDGIHLLRALHGLNSRFDTLLFVHFRSYHLDFRSKSKFDFNLICEQYLPTIIDRVVSLCLSDDDETPNLPDHFLSYRFTLDRFTNLRSLSLGWIDPQEIITTISIKSDYSSHLTHLKLTQCYCNTENDFFHLVDHIWRLPKLTHCDLGIYYVYDRSFTGLTAVSSSIEHISINNFEISARDLFTLFEHTPLLRHLCATFKYDFDAQPLPTAVPLIKKLQMSIRSSASMMIRLLNGTPNLRHLTVETQDVHFDGHKWKEIIIDHLPNLKVFRFRMNFRIHSNNNNTIEERVAELLDTFQTPFWLDEHHWFVRCEWNPQDQNENISLYSLPCGVGGTAYDLNQQKCIISTCPDDRDYWSYDSVRDIFCRKKTENWFSSPIRFCNIAFLQIRLPTHEHIWSIIPTLDHLVSLSVSLDEDAESDLEALLDRSPRLYSLTVDQVSSLRLAKLKTTNTSIRRLCLTHLATCLNATECSVLANSLLGRQCEVLFIYVENRNNILDLINTMPNLRALKCRCIDDSYRNEKDELVEWLQDHLPSTCSVCRYQIGFIRLWISR